MNFEDLQNSWQGQRIKEPADADQFKMAMETKWSRHQRKLLRSNIFLTLCFALTMPGITLVYLTYQDDFGWAFKLSIIFINILMVVFLLVYWRSYGFKKENLEHPSTSYISYQLKKLKWQRKTVTTYSQVYAVLLWINVMCYSWEVTSKAPPMFRYTALAVFTIYIFGINIWQRLTKQKRRIKDIDEIISELNHLKKELSA